MISHVGKMPPVGSYFTHDENCNHVWVMINNNDTNNCKKLISNNRSNSLSKLLYHCSYENKMWVLTQEEVDNLKIKLL